MNAASLSFENGISELAYYLDVRFTTTDEQYIARLVEMYKIDENRAKKILEHLKWCAMPKEMC